MQNITKVTTKKYASSQSLVEFFESNTDLEGVFYWVTNFIFCG